MAGKKIMAVVRGVQPRMSEMFFYTHFKNLKIRFIGDKDTGWVVEKKIPKNIEYVNLKLKPAWLFDPVTSFLGAANAHRSWQIVTDLEKYIEDVDVINISDCFYFYCGQAARLAKKLGKKLVPIVWENVSHHPSTYIPPYCFNVRAVVNSSDLFIARSHKAVSYLRSIGAAEAKIRMVYKGIDMKVFYPASKKKRNTIRILYVGQLVKSKGIDELLRAFISLTRMFPNLELWICARSRGEPLEKKIVALAKRFPIVWLGNISYDKIPQVYRECDIYCQLSQDWRYWGLLPGGNEWFSYSVMEAMASGLPVVATDVGGIPEQLGRENSFVIQKDVNSVTTAIKELIIDPGKREEIGRKNAIRARELFDITTQARKTEEAILDIL